MKGHASRQAELTSIASLEKKRKLQDEQLEMPSPKQVCRDQHLGSMEPMKVETDEFAKGDESDPESTNSNSSNSHSDCFMEARTDSDCPETPSTSSASWAGTSSGSSLYSSSEHHHQYGMHVGEFGCNADPGFSEYGHAKIEHYTDKELEDLLYSDELAPTTNFILSSGRWSVNQGAEAHQEGKKKLTIDKEFEHYFSMLML